MAANQLYLINDASTFANFSQWASAVSNQLATATWVQSTDTGQVMWSGMNLTQVVMSGTTATYTYNTLTGLALAVGRALTITGMTNAANNKTLVITSFTGTTSGTFTVTNASGVNESGSTGVVTIASSVPASNAYVYEIWQPNDGLTTFYLKVEYGNQNGANAPSMRLSIGAGTNGAGTLNGLTVGPQNMASNSATLTSSSTTIQYECNFSGAAGRFGAMMWRNASASQAPGMFAVERSMNSSGVYTGDFVTLYCCGWVNNSFFPSGWQTTLVFGIGTTVTTTPRNLSSVAAGAGFIVRFVPTSAFATFNGKQPFDLVSPYVGSFENGTMVGVAAAGSLSEGIPFQTTLFGSTRTYMPSALGSFSWSGPWPYGGNFPGNTTILCMRFD